MLMIIYFSGRALKSINTGGERRIYNILKYMKNSDVRICYVEEEGNISQRIRNNFILTNFWYISFFLKKRLGKEEIVIEDYSQRFYFLLFNLLFNLKRNSKIIILVNAFYFQYRKSPLKNWIDRIVSKIFIKGSGLVIAGGNAAANELIKLGIDNRKIKIVYPALRNEFHDCKAKTTYTIPNDTFSLLTVGRIHPVKGLEHLLDAVAGITDKNIMLKIVGNTNLYREYSQSIFNRIEELGIQDSVIFTGEINNVDELIKVYNNSDLFLLPSYWETSPSSLIEAMCMGLPIIASDVGGIKEVIANGENGLLVPPGDANALIDAITRLVDDQALRERLGKRAFADAEKYRNRTWDDVSREYLDILSNYIDSI